MKKTLGVPLSGFLLGLSLSSIGFDSWNEVHKMFTFRDLRLIFAFGLAVVALAVLWRLTRTVITPKLSPRPIHQGTLAGSVLFGAGWAITGACPAIAFVQLGSGQWGALATIAGIFCGNWLYARVHERFFTFPTTNCAED